MAKVPKPAATDLTNLKSKLADLKIRPHVEINQFAKAVKAINPKALIPINNLPSDLQASLDLLKRENKSFHGARASLSWFPHGLVHSPCNDKFGYLTSATVRNSSKLNFNVSIINLLNQLGSSMAAPGRETGILDSPIPAGYTYFGQFVDHDITLDVSSSIDSSSNAITINNMRTPALDLDSVYGRGPALDPFLYEFPSIGPSTAIKLKLGTNTNNSITGGPSTSGGGIAGMQLQNDFDVPRMIGTNTAVIGDPRNDENLFVSQFHSAMLKFHNAVVDLFVIAGFTGDIFVEAKKTVTHHYQWAVVNDYLKRICGATVVANALGSVTAAIGSSFSMPVEFSVGAYRFGHSMVRSNYWVSHRFTNQTLADAFTFIRTPNVPVLTNWVVDLNAFFNTGVTVPVFNFARKIDSVLTNGLQSLPGGSGIMASLASRNLRRGLAFGLPSGQATALALGITPMTPAQLTSGLPASEIAILNSNGGILLQKTPLWYYILREAAVLSNGDTLGPLGGKIVAETFVKMLKRDGNSYLNLAGGFIPFLPSVNINDFTVADLIIFSGANQP